MVCARHIKMDISFYLIFILKFAYLFVFNTLLSRILVRSTFTNLYKNLERVFLLFSLIDINNLRRIKMR